jgi:hypothetical protein
MAVLSYSDVLGRDLTNEESDANMHALNHAILANTAGIANLLSTLESQVTLSSTWDNRRNPFTTPAGTVMNITDVGGPGGSLWKATSKGWVPLGGSVLLAQAWGTLSAPVATISGSTGKLFVPSGSVGSLLIPAKMLIATRSSLRISCVFHRRGATATAGGRIYFGTAGTTSDSAVYNLTYGASDWLQARVDVAAVASIEVLSTNWLSAGNTGTLSTPPPVQIFEKNIDLDADMTISFGIEPATASASDAFDLIGYSVKLVSA